MVKLSKLMEKESEKSLEDTTKKGLKITDQTIHEIEKDANKKDSAYWAEIRPIPLSDIEKKSIRVSDSIKARPTLSRMKNDSIQGNGQEEKEKEKANS